MEHDLGEWVELAELLGLRTIKSPDGTEIILFRHGDLDGGAVGINSETITFYHPGQTLEEVKTIVTPMKAVIILTKMTKTYQCEVCTVYLGQGETHDHAD